MASCYLRKIKTSFTLLEIILRITAGVCTLKITITNLTVMVIAIATFYAFLKMGKMQWFCKVQIAVGMAIWVIALIKFMRIYLENEIKTKSEDYNCNPRLFVSKTRIKRLLRMTPGLMGVCRCVVFYIFIEGKPINFSIWYHNNSSFLKYILK